MLADTFSSRRGPLTSSQSQATTLSSSLLSAARKRIEYCIFFWNDRPPISKPSETLTAAVYDRGAGWQGDLLELRGNYGNGRLVYPRLCRGRKQHKSTRWIVCVCGWRESLRRRRGRPAASASTSSSQREARLWADNCIFSLTAREQYPASDVSHNLPKKYYRIEAEIRCNTCN